MPESWIDFRLLKEAVSIEQVLAHYGLLDGLKRKGDSLVGRCPLHGGVHNSNAFHVSLTKNAWKCFGDCRAGGNQLDFVARRENVELRQAAALLVEWFHVELPDPPAATPRAPVPPARPTPAPAGGPQARRKASSRSKPPHPGNEAAQALVAALPPPPADAVPSPQPVPPHPPAAAEPGAPSSPPLPCPTVGTGLPTNQPLTFQLRGPPDGTCIS